MLEEPSSATVCWWTLPGLLVSRLLLTTCILHSTLWRHFRSWHKHAHTTKRNLSFPCVSPLPSSRQIKVLTPPSTEKGRKSHLYFFASFSYRMTTTVNEQQSFCEKEQILYPSLFLRQVTNFLLSDCCACLVQCSHLFNHKQTLSSVFCVCAKPQFLYLSEEIYNMTRSIHAIVFDPLDTDAQRLTFRLSSALRGSYSCWAKFSSRSVQRTHATHRRWGFERPCTQIWVHSLPDKIVQQ